MRPTLRSRIMHLKKSKIFLHPSLVHLGIFFYIPLNSAQKPFHFHLVNPEPVYRANASQ